MDGPGVARGCKSAGGHGAGSMGLGPTSVSTRGPRGVGRGPGLSGACPRLAFFEYICEASASWSGVVPFGDDLANRAIARATSHRRFDRVGNRRRRHRWMIVDRSESRKVAAVGSGRRLRIGAQVDTNAGFGSGAP